MKEGGEEEPRREGVANEALGAGSGLGVHLHPDEVGLFVILIEFLISQWWAPPHPTTVASHFKLRVGPPVLGFARWGITGFL